MLNILDEVSKRGAGFKSLADAWADTTTAHGRLMLTILGGLAEFERDLIRSDKRAYKRRGIRARSLAGPALSTPVSGARSPIGTPGARSWLSWHAHTKSTIFRALHHRAVRARFRRALCV
jgi:hypothetical protein